MSNQQIPYDVLTQEALLGVVRTALKLVAKSGLPGEHHFYIAIDTRAEGVKLSDRLMEQYPEEMTVVLQYQFWDLEVGDDKFEVKLSFNNLPESLVVPYAAIKAFFDPSVRFGLQFGAPPGAANNQSGESAAVPAIVRQGDGGGNDLLANPEVELAIKQAIDGTNAESGEDDDFEVSVDVTERPPAEVVELDAFRKK